MSFVRRHLTTALLSMLSLMTLGFVTHSMGMGLSAIGGDWLALDRLYSENRLFPNFSISLHMVAGGVITCLAPLQVIEAIRTRWPRLHRASGYIIVTLSIITALGGFAYILQRGTIGGPLMTAGFSIYGALMIFAAVQTIRFARRRQFAIHREWALRLFVLAIGSWLYRVHYGIWFAMTGGVASYPDFSGLFDQIQVFAFYLPYLILLEIYLRARPTRPDRSRGYHPS